MGKEAAELLQYAIAGTPDASKPAFLSKIRVEIGSDSNASAAAASPAADAASARGSVGNFARPSATYPYRRKVRDTRLVDSLVGVLRFVKGLGTFAALAAVAHIGFEIAHGPRRTSPPPVRTGQPY